MKIVHEKYKSAKKYVDPVISEFQESFSSAIEYNKELDSLLNKAQVRRSIERIKVNLISCIVIEGALRGDTITAAYETTFI